MSIRLGLNGATIPGSDLLTGIHVAGGAGFSSYEPRIPRLLEVDTPQGHRAARAALTDEGLEWLPLNALENVFASSSEQIQQAAHEVCGLASGFGIGQVMVVPGAVGRDVSLNEAQDVIGTLKTIAASYEIEFLYEFIGFPRHAFPSLSQARDVARASDLRLTIDTFHLAVSRTTVETIRQMDDSEIGLVHLSDAIVGDRSVSDISDEDRVLPGEGGLPLQDYLGALADIGFGGPISVEVFHPKYECVGPGRGALEAWIRASSALTSAGFALDSLSKRGAA
ncbi:sugar phosphate isomerase/epimerase family protein [Candidatus Bipolaricaulota bacterium]